MLKYVYLAIIAGLLVLLVRNLFRSKELFFQIDAGLVIIPLILRLLLIK